MIILNLVIIVKLNRIPGSLMAERMTVNHLVIGSNPI